MLILRFFKYYFRNIIKIFLLFPAFILDCLLNCFYKDEVRSLRDKHKKIQLAEYDSNAHLNNKKTFIYDVSIIIPIYNVEKYLEECLESVLTQVCGQSIELVLVEDQSTDASFAIAKSYSTHQNITLIQNKKNAGLSKSRNVGIENARGKYLFFLDSDDVLNDGSIKHALALINKYAPDIIQGEVRRFSGLYKSPKIDITQEANLLKGKDLTQNFDQLEGFACGKFFKASLFSNQMFPLGIYFEDIIIKQLICPKATSVIITSGIVYGYRTNNQSISFTFNKKNPNNIDEYKGILYLHKKLIENFSILSGYQKKLFYRECTLMFANRTNKVDYYLLKALMQNVHQVLVSTGKERKLIFMEKVNVFLLYRGMVFSFRVINL